MLHSVVCIQCGRRGGKPTDGAAINSMGCTGACLDWVVGLITNPPWLPCEPNWGSGHIVRAAHVASFRATCSDLNDLGHAYLHWHLVHSHQGPGKKLAVHWIALARKRYGCFLSGAHEHAVATLCPHVTAFYQMLDIVHHNCLQVPTVLYTVHCDVTHAHVCRVKTTTISGQLVKDVVVPRGVPFNAWQHVPEPPYCIADDMNLYTRQEFEHYYGRKASDLCLLVMSIS